MNQILTEGRRKQLGSFISLGRVTGADIPHRMLVELGLWGLVLAAFVLDAQTTMVGLEQGFAESNPLLRTAFAVAGVSVIWQLKAAVVGLAVGCVVFLPSEDRLLVPVALGLPWAFAVFSNASLLLG